MENKLPIIHGCGVFESKSVFKKVAVTNERKVTEYEIELFKKDGGVAVINGVEHPIKKGNLLFARPEDRRFSRLHFSSHYIHFNTDDVSITRLIDSLPNFIERDISAQTEHIFEEIYTYSLLCTDYANIRCVSLLLELIYSLSDISDDLGDSENVMYKAIRFIEKHYREQITVPQIAEYCNLSTSYFYKRFLSFTGETPADYIRRKRLTAAKQMLTAGDESLNYIASECGFSSLSYFSYCFKLSEGITPIKYRKLKEYRL